MEKNDDINDFYKNLLNEFDKKPNEQNWDKLSESLDNDEFSSWYKNEIETLKRDPSPAVWNNLSHKLDTEFVWSRLAASLARRERLIWWWQFSKGGIAILITIFTILSIQYTPENVQIPTNKIAESGIIDKLKPDEEFVKTILADRTGTYPIESKEDETITSLNKVSGKTNLIENSIKRDNLINTESKDITKVSTSGNNLEITKDSSSEINSTPNNISPILFLPPITFETNPSLAAMSFVPFNENDYVKEDKNENYIFVTANISNPWQLNSETYYAFRKNSSNYNLFNIAPGFGIGYVHWLENIGIESSISYKEKGHKYMIYSEGLSQVKSIHTNFIHAELNSLYNFKNNNFSVKGGIYYARLIKQYTVLDGESIGNQSEFTNNDIGLNIGIEYMLLPKRLFIGLSINQGILNTYQGERYIAFNKTYNSVFSANLKYNLFHK